MVSLIKNLIFGKKELSTEELINQFEKSSKTIDDFKKTILNIKQNELNNILLKQIGHLNIKNINELNDLINILQEKNIIQDINLSSNSNKKQIYYLFQQLKFFNEVYNNYIKENEIFSYCFKDKYLIFNYLMEKLDTNNNLNKIIYDTYFQKEIYLKLLEYNLFNNIKKNIIFLVPTKNNIDYITNFQSIPKYCELKNYFNKIEDTDLIEENWLNLYIYFENNENLFNQLQHLQIDNFDKINSLFNLYNINKKINKNISIYNFFKNKNIHNNFYPLYNFDSYSNFTNIINDIIKFSKKKEIINIEFLPIKILEILLIKKSKYEFISFTIDKIYDSNLYDRISLINFIVKILFEFYCENFSSSIQLSKIIGHLSKIFPDIMNLSDKINKSLNFINILENNQITLTLNDLIKSENNNDNSVIMECLINYIYNISKYSIIEKEYTFIDKNYNDLQVLLNYKKIKICDLLKKFFNSYNDFSYYILKILNENKQLYLNKEEKKELLEIFLNNNSNDPNLCENIENYIKNNPNETSIIIEFEKLLIYLEIKKCFKYYNIDETSINKYNYKNYKYNINEILDIFLTKTFDIEKINSINDFLNNKASLDIQRVLKLNDNEYLYNLFYFFIKYDKKIIANEILNIFIKNNELKYFNICIEKIYNEIYKGNKEKFKNFIQENNLKIYLIENSNQFLELLIDDIDFNINNKIEFEKDKNSNNLLTNLILLDNKEIFKIDENNFKNENDILNKYKNLEKNKKNFDNLIKLYEENKITNENENINYNYSLHPKLIKILTDNNYIEYIKYIKIKFETKLKIYNFCLNLKLISINDIIEYENINLNNKINESNENIIETFKFLFNLYNKNTYEEINFILNEKKIKELDLNNENVQKILIQFNLMHKLYISYNNIKFLEKFFGFNYLKNNSGNENFIRILSDISKKINSLLFINNFENEIYPKFQKIIDKYYTNYYNILSFKNSIYFSKIQNNIEKYIILEIFNNVNLNNFLNYKKLFSYYKPIKINIFFIFILSLVYNFLSMSTVIKNNLNYGINNVINIILTFNLNLEEIKIILNEIFNYPTLSFIFESIHNILILDLNNKKAIDNCSNAKLRLANEIFKHYGENLDKFSLLINDYKIFKVKNFILSKFCQKNINKEELNVLYNKIRNFMDYNDLYDIVSDDDILRNEIYNIYTK